MSSKIIKPPEKATFIIQKKHVANTYQLSEILVGYHKNRELRSFLQFNFNCIPQKININNAFLKMFLTNNYCPDKPKTINIFQIISNWNEKKLCWRNQPLTAEIPTTQLCLCDEYHQFVSFDITELFCDWKNNNAINFGLMLTMNKISADSRLSFISSRNINSLYWPYIEICFNDSLTPYCPDIENNSINIKLQVLATNLLQYTRPIEILRYNYAYHVINNGCSPARVYLQTSADRIHWLTDSSSYIINPQDCVAIVSSTSAQYSHLGYQTTMPNKKTNLEIYIQGNLV